MEFYCANCGRKELTNTMKSHCDCGDLEKMNFQPPRFDERLINRDEGSLFRYRRFMIIEAGI